MTVSPTTATEPTDDEIDAAILREIDTSRDEFVPWAQVRERVPGSFWRKGEALARLFCSGRVYAIKVRGRNYVALGDEHDIEIAKRHKAAGCVPGVRCL
ncbi:hypothetical protein H7I77_01855 [Mycolicibacterium novocastrense]|uniref:Uncharacterized protein n=1 Tax=Mycolicibacterium novocastrense TaxID=59813 RepID=A0AAW5SF08_MYCNV|nr:hypothetical protein [Mycolicibacterium novocastrense]MCV7022096.1 hypothetical protein [Mycolicibacterium novocastrense]GAT09375.1 uncharacterized protein RMCN_2508 [Mycolicibacterium novocastrense]